MPVAMNIAMQYDMRISVPTHTDNMTKSCPQDLNNNIVERQFF